MRLLGIDFSMRYLYIFVLLYFGLSGCVKNNPAPIWLDIDKWTLNSNPNSSVNPGTLTQNFTDVWVYIDGNVIGVFELPCKIPVLVSGSCKVTLYPAIRNNGISATKKIYPFVEPFENTMNLVEGETYSINPVTRYYSETKFWVEDFENSTIKITPDPISNATLNVENNSSVGAWGYYGHIALTSSDSLWVGLSTDVMYLPKSGAEVYLEVNYKNSNSLLTGIISYPNGGSGTDNPNISMNSQGSNATWKKIYIDLKDIVSNTPTSAYYKPYFRALLDSGLSSGDVYIDNIKVVHF